MSVVGIDLGTTNTVAGCVRGGKVHVLADENGARLLPSVVSFHPSGEVLVGALAKARRLIDARNTVYSHKRLIGRSWGSTEISQARARFPFELREGPGQGPLIHARNQDYTLPEISAFVLKRAKQIAEAALGSAVERAVITVPAHFNELQRASTKVAGRISGLEVLRILNEPTAAALAYGLGRVGSERVAVYDFGGGTFDCTLLDLNGNVFEVLATAGDSFLGGDDIDNLVADRMAETFLKLTRIDVRDDPQQFERLKASAEDVKVALSRVESHTVILKDVAHGPGGRALPLHFTLTRRDLDALIAPLVERTFKVTQDALSLARLSPGSFDKVILVGGSTRIPLVRKQVETFFGRQPLDKVNPDEVVAIGAAIQAAALTEGIKRRSIPAPPPRRPPADRPRDPFGTSPPEFDFGKGGAPGPHDVKTTPPDQRPTSPANAANAAKDSGAVAKFPAAPNVPAKTTTQKGPAFTPPQATGARAGTPAKIHRRTIAGVAPGDMKTLTTPIEPFGTVKEDLSLISTPGASAPSTERDADFGHVSDLSLIEPPDQGAAKAAPAARPPGGKAFDFEESADTLEHDKGGTLRMAPEANPAHRPPPGQGAGAALLGTGKSRAGGETAASVKKPTQPGLAPPTPGATTQPMAKADAGKTAPMAAVARPPHDRPNIRPSGASGSGAHPAAKIAPEPAETTQTMSLDLPRGAPTVVGPGFDVASAPPPPPPLARTMPQAPPPPPPVTQTAPTFAQTMPLTASAPPPRTSYGPSPGPGRPPSAPSHPPLPLVDAGSGGNYASAPPPLQSNFSAPPMAGHFSASPQAPALPSTPPLQLADSVPTTLAAKPASAMPVPAGMGERAPVLVDVTPRALVVETVGGYVDTIIPRNAKIPCERTRRFTTGRDMQTTVRVRVAQGEGAAFGENTYLGEVELTGLRPAARGEVTVAVTFEVDADGTLRVRARDVQTGQEGRATLQLVGIADESSVVLMMNRLANQPVAGGPTHH